MVASLLLRGLLVGLVAGLIGFGFATLVGEPQVDAAIAFEASLDQAKGEAPEPELVSREIQGTFGLLTGVVVYGAAIGGLFSLVFAYAAGRVGRVGPRGLAALLSLAGFVAIVLVPGLKYPANPPSVGDAGTIGERTRLFFLMLAVSIAAMALAIALFRRTMGRLGVWNAALAAAGCFLAVTIATQLLLPDINEVPDAFPAVLLWRFRLASLGLQLVLWSAVGLLFGWLTERSP